MSAINDEKIPLLNRLDNYGLNGTKKGIRGRDVGELVQGFKNLLELIPDKGIIHVCKYVDINTIL